MKNRAKILITALVSTLLLLGTAAMAEQPTEPHTKTPFRINIAEWSDQIEVLRVQGKCQYNCVIEVFNEGSGELIAVTEEVPGKTWYVTIPENGSEPPLEPVPCVVGAHQIGTEYCKDKYDTLDVQ
ncbi:MAG: hypothetical protein ABFS45_01570, partial [Pseudomonadota bacterium]